MRIPGQSSCRSDKLLRFKFKILELDPHARFLIGGNVLMIHSEHRGLEKQKGPYNTSKFAGHVKKCLKTVNRRIPGIHS